MIYKFSCLPQAGGRIRNQVFVIHASWWVFSYHRFSRIWGGQILGVRFWGFSDPQFWGVKKPPKKGGFWTPKMGVKNRGFWGSFWGSRDLPPGPPLIKDISKFLIA